MKRIALLGIWLCSVLCFWLAVRLFLLWLYRGANGSGHFPFWSWDSTAGYALLSVFFSFLVWNLFWIKTLRQFSASSLFAIVGGATCLALFVNTTMTGATYPSTLFKGLEETIFGSRVFEVYEDDAILVVIALVNQLTALLSATIFTATFLLQKQIRRPATDSVILRNR
jgi:hypothetical protein